MHIPRLSERLECIIYRRRLELELAEVKPDLDIVRNAGAEVKASKRLRRVLGVSDCTICLYPISSLSDCFGCRQRP